MKRSALIRTLYSSLVHWLIGSLVSVRRPIYLLFCLPLLLFCCKKDSAKKLAGPACYDFMTIDSNMTMPEAAYANYYYFNSQHQLIEHVVTSGGAVAWSDTFEYVHGHMVKSLMSLGGNSTADYYTRSEYDYTDSLVTASRYYLDAQVIVNSAYTYDAKGQLTSYSQHSDNTTLQPDGDYTYNLAYDDNGNVTQVTDQYGTVKVTFGQYDDKPNPYYKMPFDFAYDPFSYYGGFSKHNAGQENGLSFSYTYTNGKISKEIMNLPDGVVLQKVNSLCK